MPELPELEAFVRAQRERLCAEPVAEVPVAHFATVKTVDPPPAALVGRRFSEVRRRAKRLLFETEDSGPVLMVHLMSAGRLAVGPGHPKSAVLAVRFEDDTELAMSEAGRKRRAGAWILTPQAVAEQLAHIGPEPLDPGVRHSRACGGAGAAPAPAARVSARPAGDRRDRARLRERDPARGAAVAVRDRRVAHAGAAGAAARGDRGAAQRGHGAAGSPVPEGAGGKGRARLPGARPAGQAVPGVRE